MGLCLLPEDYDRWLQTNEAEEKANELSIALENFYTDEIESIVDELKELSALLMEGKKLTMKDYKEIASNLELLAITLEEKF